MPVPLPPRLAYPLSFLSGLLYFVAFPGVDVWPLSFVALVPLFISLAGQSPKRGFWIGWTAGFGMTIAGFYWLSYTLKVFSGFPTPLCWLFQAILCGYQAGRIGLFGWLATRGALRGWGRGLTLALAFAASELLFPLLFPWFYGATVHQVPALIQLAELGGPIAVSLVLLATNYGLAELLLSRWEKRKPDKVALGLIALPLLAAIYGWIRMPMVDAKAQAAEKVEVGLVQANMTLEGKRNNKREGLDRHLKLTKALKSGTPLDLVVWSETSVMSGVLEDDADHAMRQQFTRSLGVPALFGAVLVRKVEDAREYVFFNSALLTNRKGSVVGRTDKQLLLAFGEYLPFGDTFPVLYEWSPHSGRFKSGETFTKPVKLGEHELAVVICYEDVLPSFVNRLMGQGDPELLANLTNDAWFGDSTEPWIHLALAKFRAVEQRRFFVRSTNSGVSAFVDPVGRVISNTKTFEEASQRATLRWLKGKTPYALWGDAPWWVVSVVSVAMAFRRRRRRVSAAAGGAPGVPAPSEPPDFSSVPPSAAFPVSAAFPASASFPASSAMLAAAPVVEEPDPGVTEPDPGVTEPDPGVTEPARVPPPADTAPLQSPPERPTAPALPGFPKPPKSDADGG